MHGTNRVLRRHQRGAELAKSHQQGPGETLAHRALAATRQDYFAHARPKIVALDTEATALHV